MATSWRFRWWRFCASVLPAMVLPTVTALFVTPWLIPIAAALSLAMIRWYLSAERRDMNVAMGLNPDGSWPA